MCQWFSVVVREGARGGNSAAQTCAAMIWHMGSLLLPYLGLQLDRLGPQKDRKVDDGEGNVECKEIRLHIFWDIELF